jgi:hypothetical protein
MASLNNSVISGFDNGSHPNLIESQRHRNSNQSQTYNSKFRIKGGNITNSAE